MTEGATLPQTELAALAAELGPGVLTTAAEARERCARDETEDLRFLPEAVALPASTAEVQRILRFAHEHRIPLTPRGAGTGLSGGALPVQGGIVLSLERMNRIREIDRRNLVAVAEAGVVTAELQRAVEAVGLFYPPDPSSRESCQLGGNIAEDAAGPRSAKYGTTRRYVLGLEAVLADGSLLTTGGKNRKDATGYNLTQLLVGSEGTLAVVTAATLRLLARPAATLTMILPFAALEAAAAAVERIFSDGFDPAACEIAERAALAAVALVEPLPRELAGSEAMLLLELDGADPETLLAAAAGIDSLAQELGASPALVADDAAGQRRLWQIRRRIGEAVKHLSVYKEADTVVPRAALAELVTAARAAAQRQGLTAICYGHAGDGNLHVNLLRGGLSPELWVERRDRAEEELFRAVVALGGKISGEHGIGFAQKALLPLALPAVEIAAMRALKTALDPRGILNPGKIFPDRA
ncbi:MAG: FAD-binding protein [Thermoanaerobaculia bacterium]|nr:FAD-binding protein [Thermoanaerobaculia bacterium]